MNIRALIVPAGRAAARAAATTARLAAGVPLGAKLAKVNRLPTAEEQQWLNHAFKKIIAKRRGLLDGAPLVEPTNRWFPEKWSTTAASGHQLAQRLMHYAGLGEQKLHLSAYEPQWNEDEEEPWDAGTAGWFAGIHADRAFFGLHVQQFGDPEAAAGVLAHEVAHAWRRHHHLVIEDREKEELLTDVTTVALGFGILTANNTDRYRASGTWNETAWSVSSVGYLYPQAMCWLLAIWSAARGVDGERRAIEHHLEPNQQSFFRAALEELENTNANARKLLHAAPLTSRPVKAVPAPFTPLDPMPEEIDEPEQTAPDPQPNRGTTIHQKARGNVLEAAFFGMLAAFFVVWIVAVLIEEAFTTRSVLIAGTFAIGSAIVAVRLARRPACSACNTDLAGNPSVCPGCGGDVGPRVTTRELKRIREEDMERRAREEFDDEDCEECQPERPCQSHAPTFAFTAPFDRDPEDPEDPEKSAARFPSARRRFIAVGRGLG